MPLANVDESLKRLGAFAGMLNDCSALVVLHVDESGRLTFHRSGNIYAQLGAVDMMTKGLTNSLAEDDWDPDAES